MQRSRQRAVVFQIATKLLFILCYLGTNQPIQCIAQHPAYQKRIFAINRPQVRWMSTPTRAVQELYNILDLRRTNILQKRICKEIMIQLSDFISNNSLARWNLQHCVQPVWLACLACNMKPTFVETSLLWSFFTVIIRLKRKYNSKILKFCSRFIICSYKNDFLRVSFYTFQVFLMPVVLAQLRETGFPRVFEKGG